MRPQGGIQKTPNDNRIRIEYFGPGYGRVDPIRQLLEHHGVEWEFIPATQEAWGARKAAGDTGEMGALPMATVNGQQRQQTCAILRSFGIQYGYYNPTDWRQCGFVDMVVETENEILSGFGKVLLFTPDPDKPAALEKLKDGAVKNLLRICENRLLREQTKFIAGDNLTIADFSLAALVFNILKNEMFPMHAAVAPVLLEFPMFGAYTIRLQNALSKHLNAREKLPF